MMFKESSFLFPEIIYYCRSFKKNPMPVKPKTLTMYI